MVSGILLLSGFGMFSQTTTNNLPQVAQDYINEHFSSITVAGVEENSNWKIWEDEKYEVKLSNGIELDFDENGNIIEIDSQSAGSIPNSALSSNIVTYLDSSYSGVAIIGWEKHDKGQEVELADGTEVEFDANGKFLRID